jgi:hypothetical protein
MKSNSFPTVNRVIAGADKLAGVVSHLAKSSVWFMVEPRPHDRFVVKVKAEAEQHLPRARVEADWEKGATLAELVSVAQRHFETDFLLNDGSPDVRLSMPPQVLERDPTGFIMAAQVFVPYPENEA